ncbi:MAG: hypothetical protein KDB37_03795 [Ilumatobacter sp.]|nr:hypothetical protein [Ilumatobacter sp.]
MTDARIPGPGLDDPVVVVSDGGFRAEIAADEWLTVGASCQVSTTKLGPWPGDVMSFARSAYIVAEWRLKSGAHREMRRIDTSSPGLQLGHNFPVRHGANTWTATVTHIEPATTVRIAYTIQSGATRQRDFFRRGRIEFYGKPTVDGQIAVYRFRD